MDKARIIISWMLIFILCFSSFALASSQAEFKVPDTNEIVKPGEGAQNLFNTILTLIKMVAFAVALGMILVIGIKYMSAGAGFKADAKSTFLPYLIGALIVGSATQIIQVFINIGE